MNIQAMTEKTVDQLHDLIEVNVDAAQGMTTAAEEVKDADLKAFFRQVAMERDRFAAELRAELPPTESARDDDGTALAKIHRWWIELKGSLSSDSRHTILVEAERGEDHIKKLYSEALVAARGTRVHGLIAEQSVRVTAVHDRVRDLRDQAA